MPPLQTLDIAAFENHFFENDNTDFDDAESMIRLMQKLPVGFRAVLNLYVIEEKSHEEIARELGIAVSTSRSQLARAKQFLRRLMDKTMLLLV